MEVQRLVVEEPEHTLALDLHTGLTVAFHQRPAVRAQVLDDLVSALGEGRAGLHLELVDHQARNLAVFRPRGARPRVIDIDARADLSAGYRSPSGGVDLVARLGLDADAVGRLMRIGARQLDRLPDTGTDNHRDARRLAGVDPAALWPAAERLDRADVALARARLALPGRTVADVEAFDRLEAEHAAYQETVHRHRPIQRLGWTMTGLCLAIGIALLGLDRQVGDNAFTGQVLVGLGILAGAVTVYDRQAVRVARRSLQQVVTRIGAGAGTAGPATAAFDQVLDEAGPLADPERRRTLVDATAEHAAALEAWRQIAADISPVWALRHRPAIEALAAQRSQLHKVGAGHLVSDDTAVADAARLLVDRVIELQEVGPNRERLPLLLDEPFAGSAPSDVQRLLETLLRLSSHHQILLVTGDRYIQAWAAEMAATGAVALVRLDEAVTSTFAHPATSAAGAPPRGDAPAASGAGPQPSAAPHPATGAGPQPGAAPQPPHRAQPSPAAPPPAPRPPSAAVHTPQAGGSAVVDPAASAPRQPQLT